MVDAAGDACAGQVTELLVAGWDDEAAMAEFAKRVDVVTFDFENVPAATAESPPAGLRYFRTRVRWPWPVTASPRKPCSASRA